MIIIMMPFIAYAFLQSSRVQTYLVGHLTDYFSRELQTEISVGSVDIRLFRSVILKDVIINDRQGDLILEMRKMRFELGKLSFQNRSLVIKELEFRDAFLNLFKDKQEENYNFQFLVDYFSSPTVANGHNRWEFTCEAFKLTNASFWHLDLNRKSGVNGFDPANFYVSGFYLAMNQIEIVDNTLSLALDYLYYNESSGFIIDYLSGNFLLKHGQLDIDNFIFRTDGSDLNFSLSAKYGSFTSLEELVADLRFQMDIGKSVLHLADLGHFIPGLYGVNDTMKIEGAFEVLGDTLTGDNVLVEYGLKSRFDGDFQLKNFLGGSDMRLEFTARTLQSNFNEIAALNLPVSLEKSKPEFPPFLYNLGDFEFSGRIYGGLHSFQSEGSLASSIGTTYANLLMQRDNESMPYQYQAKVNTRNLDIGRLFGIGASAGKATLELNIKGEGFHPDNLDLLVDGHIASVELASYTYNDISFQTEFLNQNLNGQLGVKDQNLLLDITANAQFDKEIPFFDVLVNIEHANMTKLALFQKDSLVESLLKTHIHFNGKVSSLDSFEGDLVFREIRYEEIPLEQDHHSSRYLVFTDSIFINSKKWSPDNQHIRLRSGFADADVHGKLHLTALPRNLKESVQNILPFGEPDLSGYTGTEYYQDQDIQFSFHFKDTRILSELFLPALSLSGNSWLNGHYRSADHHLIFIAHADTLALENRRFLDLNIGGTHGENNYSITFDSKRLMVSDSLHFDLVSLQSGWKEQSLDVKLEWQGTNGDESGIGVISGHANVYDKNHIEFSFLPSYALIHGDLWRINIDNKIIVDSSRIEVSGLMVYHGDQFIRADGVLSDHPRDRMMVSFSNFEVAYSDLFLGESNFKFGGILDGYVTFTALYQSPSIGAGLTIQNFAFNHQELGDLQLSSIWQFDKQAFLVDGKITSKADDQEHNLLTLSGSVYTGQNIGRYDLGISLHNMKMEVWRPYVQSFSENFKGLATGELHLGGPLNSPELTGQVRLMETSMHIPYLNVTYFLEDDVRFTKNAFVFEDVAIRDTLGNIAKASGAILHNSLRGFGLDLHIRPSNTIVFNTTAVDNSIYHGTGFVTGLAHLHGPVNDITMDITARTNRGTRVILPLNSAGEVRENHFITFVARSPENNLPLMPPPDLSGNITLNFDLEVTPEAEVLLMFSPPFGDIIRGRGNGNLKLEIPPDGAFNIYGDYVITEGEYLFNLQNIINKRFRIEQGSTIRWTGDLNDADVEMQAAYRLRTSLYDLFVGEGIDSETVEMFRRRVPVETLLILQDRLFNPTISFDIQVPGGDENTREMIERVITTEQEMNRQVFSLLVLNRFLPSREDQYNTALGFGVGSTSSELLSNQLSNWLSQISTDFDIGINYRPGDEITSQEVELALSTQLFDNRVTIDGNFGVAGNQTASGQPTQATNQIIGDVNVEVMITPEGKLRVKAFNRSNTFDIIHTNAPYTQGIGVFYRKEFDRLEELFRRNRIPEIPVDSD